MDETFQLRARREQSEPQPAPLDFPMLSAALTAQQAASAAAKAQAVATARAGATAQGEPLAALLLAGPGWRGGADAQRGCFSRLDVKHPVNKR